MMPPSRLTRMMLPLLFATCSFSSLQVSAQVNVWTWHNDNGRTGQNASETSLTPSSVNKTGFGQLCSYGGGTTSPTLDGQVYAQPLVLWDSVNSRNLVYVVTQNDSLYMFDGTNHAASVQQQSVQWRQYPLGNSLHRANGSKRSCVRGGAV